MKNKKLALKILCLVLMTTLIAPFAAACKKADPVSAAVREHVYKAEYFQMPEEFGYFNYVVTDGITIYAVVDENDTKTGDYQQRLIAVDVKTGEYRRLALELKNEYSETGSSGTNVNSMKMGDDGNLVVVINSYTSEMNPTTQEWRYEEAYRLVTVDSQTGNEMTSMDLSNLAGDEEGAYFYVQNMAALGDKIVITTGEALFVLDGKSGKKDFDIKINGWIDNIFVTNGKVLVNMYDYSSDNYTRSVKELDFASKSFKDTQLSLPGEGYRFTFLSGEGYDIYLNDNMMLYGYSLETQELTELLNWIDSDIDSDNISSITPVSAEEIICVGYNYDSGGMEVTKLTKVAPEDVIEKTVLTMAVNYLNYDVRKAIIAFNKSNEKYRITINDYSQYNTDDNYNAGAEKLNTDIIAGKVPDIVFVDAYSMPVDSFISKGLFADLYPMMDKDPDFNRADYLTNVFDALSKDGKLYSIVPTFNVQTVMGKVSDVGDRMGWTMDDLNALMATKPAGTAPFANASRETILYLSTYMAMDSFIDKNTGKCSFDTGAFAQMLEFAASFPSQEELNAAYDSGMRRGGVALAVASGAAVPTSYYDYMTDGGYVSDEELIRSGRAVLQQAYVYDYNDYMNKKFAYGEQPIYIGFPNDSGIGSVMTTGMEFALYSKSKNLAGGWEFVKYFLSDEYQGKVEWDFPVKRSRLDELAEAAMKPYSYTWTDEKGEEHVEVYPRTYWINGQSVELDDMTQQDVDRVNELLFTVNTVMRYDTKVNDIITEEADVFFNGQRSAQEAAGIVQSRVQTYVSESR